MTTSIIELNQLNCAQKWALAEAIIAVEKHKEDPFPNLSTDLLQAVEKNSSLENAKLLEQLSATLATEKDEEDEEEEEEEEE